MGGKRSLCHLVGLGLLVLSAACSGGSAGLGVSPADAAGHSIALTAVPGTDFDPRRLTVTYQDEIDAIALPGGTEGTAVAPDMVAPPNAVLRTRPEYEQLTAAIAARFDLTVTNQVYLGRTNLAGFELPVGADGAAVLAGMRGEFGDYIATADFSHLGRFAYLPDDPLLAESTAESGPQWQVPRMNVPAAWDITMGSPGVLVAILDTGVRLTHEELAATVIDPAVEFPEVTADVYNHIKEITDGQGHGTSVASLIVAEGDNGRTMTGVAPGCRLLPIRVAPDFGGPSDAAVVEGAYLARELGADIVSMSIYFIDDHPALRTAMADLYASGMLLFASAGNQASSFGQYPASYPGVVSVGGTSYDDSRTANSNFSPDVELAAPGTGCTAACYLADSGDSAYVEFGGTSAAAPLAAGCAALVWSVYPDLTNEEVRRALRETGAPVTGYPTALTRPDLARLLESWDSSSYRPGYLEQDIYTTWVTLGMEVTGGLGWLQATQASNGYTASLTAAPWEFSFDLRGIAFGTELVTFESDAVSGEAVQTCLFPVDNTAGAFPLDEDLDTADIAIIKVDGQRLADGPIAGLYFLDEKYGTAANLHRDGGGYWQRLPEAGTAGSGGLYFGDEYGGGYDDFELDLAVLPLVDLTGVYDGQLRFSHRWNIEAATDLLDGDAGFVVVRPQSTGVWEIAPHVDRGQAAYAGWQGDWVGDRVLLTDYADELVQLGFLFNSNIAGNGEEPGEPAGWWVDDIEVTDGAPKIGYASFHDLEVTPGSSLGRVPGVAALMIELAGAVNVDRAVFTLDTAPIGEANAEDVTVQRSYAPYAAELAVPLDMLNSQAEVRVTVFNLLGEAGRVQTVPVFIYNLAGDANGDGAVNAADSALIQDSLWLTPADSGYSPFLDTDGDGVVSEADASAVGYCWTE